MNCKRHRFGSRFVVTVSLMLASWRATGAIQARAQEGLSHAEARGVAPPLRRIDQDKLLLGDYTLREVIDNSRHLFTTPFIKAEGYGERGKPNGSGGFLIGPRELTFPQNLDAFRIQTQSGLSSDQLRQFPVPEVNPSTQKIVYPYLRLNGLDSQSCWECHNFIGSERLPDTRTYELSRKQSANGGSGDSPATRSLTPTYPIRSSCSFATRLMCSAVATPRSVRMVAGRSAQARRPLGAGQDLIRVPSAHNRQPTHGRGAVDRLICWTVGLPPNPH